ncbi:MAG: hypothetical protein HY517_02340 [Candidatus Aenigmarchaeota archaeon]|nr:hypothetical protein [Candidatus Aenigmarchaeota archaeon]
MALFCGAAASLAVPISCGKSPSMSAEERLISSGLMSVEPVRRYRDGSVLDLRRLRVYPNSEACADRMREYGDTAGHLVFDNMGRILERHRSAGIFREGFEYSDGRIGQLSRDAVVNHMAEKRPFVRESNERADALLKLGIDIHHVACSDKKLNEKTNRDSN